MERVSRIVIFMSALAAALAAVPASGGLILVPPPRPSADQGPEVYPESRFGQAPARISPRDIDAGNPGALRSDETETDRYAAAEPEKAPGNRSPAGLVVGEEPQGTRSSASVSGSMSPRSAPSAEVYVPQSMKGNPELPSPETEAAAIRRKGVQEVAIIAGDLGFFPRTIFVTRDVPVRMFVTGASKNSLCIMMDSFQVRKQVRSQKIEEISFTPNQPGKYRFYCPVNGMEGTLVVKELASNITQ